MTCGQRTYMTSYDRLTVGNHDENQGDQEISGTCGFKLNIIKEIIK